MITHQDLHSRTQRRVSAVVVGGLALVLGVLTAWAGVSRLAEGRWPSYGVTVLRELSSVTWASVAGWAIAVGLLLAGILLLALAVRSGEYRSLPIRLAASPHVHRGTAYLSGKGLARLAVAHVNLIDGVESSSATVTGRLLRVRVSTTLDDTTGLAKTLRESLAGRLKASGLDPLPHIAVSARRQDV